MAAYRNRRRNAPHWWFPKSGRELRRTTAMNHEKHVNRLIDGAEELVSKLQDTPNPDIQRLRDRVNVFVSDARRENSDRPRRRSVKITRIPGSLREYVHEHPFLAVVTAASLAWTLGHLSSAARARTAGR
jgi:ElaB/YqjD/DUF883 family membrane-anchored ribosome-binding protein